ncbi:MAG: GNAT family N-acetyltransferase [Chloroflexota bacterium]
MKDIQFSGLDFSNQGEISRIARIHMEGPLDWIEGYQVSEEAVEQTYKVLSESNDNPNTHVIVARDRDKSLVGFHWISIVPEDEDSARIESLWIDESYRRRGIATKLKGLGEVWVKEKGAKQIITTVFYVNKKMIDLNIKEGFVPGQVQMTKQLSCLNANGEV